MRPGQNKRMRGRNNNNRKGPNPLTRTYESNGPDVKIRGTAHHVGEKYLQLARDAQSSGDPVMAENYLQHAEHYFRILNAMNQAAQQQQQQQGDGRGPQHGGGRNRFQPQDDQAQGEPQAAEPAGEAEVRPPPFAPGLGDQPEAREIAIAAAPPEH